MSSTNRSLIEASRKGDVALVYQILEQGDADINQTDKDGETALTIAAENGHETIVKHLVEKGAEINHQNKKGSTGLIIAGGGVFLFPSVSSVSISMTSTTMSFSSI